MASNANATEPLYLVGVTAVLCQAYIVMFAQLTQVEMGIL